MKKNKNDFTFAVGTKHGKTLFLKMAQAAKDYDKIFRKPSLFQIKIKSAK